jgi:hypothetical protein
MDPSFLDQSPIASDDRIYAVYAAMVAQFVPTSGNMDARPHSSILLPFLP